MMLRSLLGALACASVLAVAGVSAQAPTVPLAPPSAYLIGPDDVLSIVFWRDKDLSADVAVRPDGRISLPLLNEVQAAGLTPMELRDAIDREAHRFIDDPNVTVVVKQINSRRVFVTGLVMRPGPYPLMGPLTVVQALAMAGGLREDADDKHVVVMRTENGRPVAMRVNYRDISAPQNLRQNIELKPGDTVVVR
jgi:polysaccharide export outer membrane protein